MASASLPTDWSKILDEVQMRLDQAIASANARMAQMPNAEPARFAAGRADEIARWQERLRRLSAYLESAEQIVQSVDEILDTEEKGLRNHLALTASLRQKLAEVPAGAIGYKA